MKSILLVGPPASGKSLFVNELMANSPHSIKLDEYDATKVGLYSFSKCTPDTDLVIIEGCGIGFPFWKYINLITGGIEVRRKGTLDTFTIHPTFVFVAQFDEHEIPDLGESFLQRTTIRTI